MKALSVKQPWAGNIAIGRKTAEIRSRKIKPQGDILICASLQSYKDIGRFQCNNNELWQHKHCSESLCDYYGKAIAVVEWYDTVIFTKSLCEDACFDQTRWPFGFYENPLATGEMYIPIWAWMFRNFRPIKPFPVKGKQGLFEIDDSLIEYL